MVFSSIKERHWEEFPPEVLLKKQVIQVKQHIFQEVKKFKIQRCCKGCGNRIVVENANRYYCKGCRGY